MCATTVRHRGSHDYVTRLKPKPRLRVETHDHKPWNSMITIWVSANPISSRRPHLWESHQRSYQISNCARLSVTVKFRATFQHLSRHLVQYSARHSSHILSDLAVTNSSVMYNRGVIHAYIKFLSATQGVFRDVDILSRHATEGMTSVIDLISESILGRVSEGELG